MSVNFNIPHPPIATVKRIKNKLDLVTIASFDRRETLDEVESLCPRSDVSNGERSPARPGTFKCCRLFASRKCGEAFRPSLKGYLLGDGDEAAGCGVLIFYSLWENLP